MPSHTQALNLSESIFEAILLPRNNPPLLQISNNNPHRLLNAHLVRPDMNLGLLGRLVGRANPSELFDLASPGLLVQTLGIAFLDDGNGSIDEDFNEGQRGVVLCVQLSGQFAVGDVRANKGCEG